VFNSLEECSIARYLIESLNTGLSRSWPGACSLCSTWLVIGHTTVVTATVVWRLVLGVATSHLQNPDIGMATALLSVALAYLAGSYRPGVVRGPPLTPTHRQCIVVWTANCLPDVSHAGCRATCHAAHDRTDIARVSSPCPRSPPERFAYGSTLSGAQSCSFLPASMGRLVAERILDLNTESNAQRYEVWWCCRCCHTRLGISRRNGSVSVQ